MYISGTKTLDKRKEELRFRIGERVRTFRKSKKWTQKDVGKKYGIPSSNISKMETGQKSFPAEVIPLMADDYNVLAEQFFL